jgi:drug/metabolite transporter (DMT)-like permease
VLDAFRSVGGPGIAVAVCVAAASGSFIAALNHTSVARVLFILALSPVLAALLARVTLGEPITRRTAAAMALALAGVAVMLGAPGEGSLTGDVLSFVTALAFAIMIVITRWRQDVSMAPATCLSQAILVVVFLPFASPNEIGGEDLFWLAALGIGQIGLGFALLTVGARLIPAAQVGLITLLEVVLGPWWVWLALDERPTTLTLVGGAIVIVAIVIQTRAPEPSEPDDQHALPAPH